MTGDSLEGSAYTPKYNPHIFPLKIKININFKIVFCFRVGSHRVRCLFLMNTVPGEPIQLSIPFSVETENAKNNRHEFITKNIFEL